MLRDSTSNYSNISTNAYLIILIDLVEDMWILENPVLLTKVLFLIWNWRRLYLKHSRFYKYTSLEEVHICLFRKNLMICFCVISNGSNRPPLLKIPPYILTLSFTVLTRSGKHFSGFRRRGGKISIILYLREYKSNCLL